MRISYHCWTESMVSSLANLQEGQVIPQYYYVSSSNKHVNKMDEEWITTLVFASDDRTRSKSNQNQNQIKSKSFFSPKKI